MRIGTRLAAVAAALALVATRAAASGEAPRKAAPAPAGAKDPGGELIQATSPPFSEGIFPCTQCHTGKGDATRRALGFHDEIQAVFSHDEEHRWCLDCHDNANRDVLHLSSGASVPFTESYRLCGQCHGDKFRDGKRIGQWNGAKTYFLCVNCHNPHSPRFKGVTELTVDGKRTVAPTLTPMKPEPPPVRPEVMKR
jgi:hypothetical protein